MGNSGVLLLHQLQAQQHMFDELCTVQVPSWIKWLLGSQPSVAAGQQLKVWFVSTNAVLDCFCIAVVPL